MNTINAREAALCALLNYDKEGTFLYDSLDQFAGTPQDLALAYELACGVMRVQRLLDAVAVRLLTNKKLPTKKRERWLLRLALYQCYFLTRIPLHAIAYETVQLAKKYTGGHFSGFLNAVIRAVNRSHMPEPTSLAERYSYPDFFVESLRAHFDVSTTTAILAAGNAQTRPSARVRNQSVFTTRFFDSIDSVAASTEYYIQNPTQPKLMYALAERLQKRPQRILDLCAAPGGKTILLHELFPHSELFVNDVAAKKMTVLQHNLEKYGVPATVSCCRGETFSLSVQEPLFDLVVVDSPCSNSGVLYKCPEARWRMSREEISKLNHTQMALLKNAKQKLLHPQGVIWYMTCSILHQENQELVAKACEEFGLQVHGEPILQLPDGVTHEGGFACQLYTS